jgi:hypothetical protein
LSGIVISKSVIGLPACLFARFAKAIHTQTTAIATTNSKPSEMRLLNLPPAVLSSTMQTT